MIIIVLINIATYTACDTFACGCLTIAFRFCDRSQSVKVLVWFFHEFEDLGAAYKTSSFMYLALNMSTQYSSDPG
ncbi:unnamed protein product [Albugo candida]|uniref:Uncharacterized protein n=1 Tax=Albugo candida TaxID=65357 RepID=A0A024GR88_9STRA|nr:unnamed protein product [Albugo candida]|eukprot:CCI48863.1 unnamed protein product [Albugo candida]